MKAELEKHCVNRDLDSQLVFERDSWDEFFEHHVVKEVFYRFVNRAKNPVPIHGHEGVARNPVASATAIMDFRGVKGTQSPLNMSSFN